MLDAAEKPCFSNALTEPFEAKPCRKNAAKTWDSQLAQKIFFFPRNLHCMETKSILVSRFNRARINLGDCVLRNLSSLASTLREISDEGGSGTLSSGDRGGRCPRSFISGDAASAGVGNIGVGRVVARSSIAAHNTKRTS